MRPKNWQELPIGVKILEPGNSQEYKTGSWRVNRPVLDIVKCIQCLFCWVFCPDSAILLVDAKVVAIDYDHCKGCGICAHECPEKANAITMVPEHERQ
jgi:pyruvate ferredoxin oxidoreductase delta subunit